MVRKAAVETRGQLELGLVGADRPVARLPSDGARMLRHLRWPTGDLGQVIRTAAGHRSGCNVVGPMADWPGCKSPLPSSAVHVHRPRREALSSEATAM